MRRIDLETWPRRDHFRVYGALDQPHFGMTAEVDLTAFYPRIKASDTTLTVAITYLLARVANEIPEFRLRIRGDEVVEHDRVHPSITIMTEGDLFGFCTFDFVEEFSEFAVAARETIAHMTKHPTLEDEPGRDDLLFMTAIPWVSFTSFLHPMNLEPPDSFPRLAWGKIRQTGESMRMPLGVQVHHGLMDGIHVGTYYRQVQAYLDQPGFPLVAAR